MSEKIAVPAEKRAENSDGIFLVFIRVIGTRIYTLCFRVFLLFFIWLKPPFFVLLNP